MFGLIVAITISTAVLFVGCGIADYKYDLIEKYRGYDDDFEEEI